VPAITGNPLYKLMDTRVKPEVAGVESTERSGCEGRIELPPEGIEGNWIREKGIGFEERVSRGKPALCPGRSEGTMTQNSYLSQETELQKQMKTQTKKKQTEEGYDRVESGFGTGKNLGR